MKVTTQKKALQKQRAGQILNIIAYTLLVLAILALLAPVMQTGFLDLVGKALVAAGKLLP